MIEGESYLLFVAASIMYCIVPGPDMIYLLSRSVAQGKKSGMMAALGLNAGAYCHLFAAIVGISAVLATSSVAFTIIKWAGAAYLVYLGLQAISNRGAELSLSSDNMTESSGRAIFWQGFWNDVLNPKVAVFFLAILPQFINPESGNQFYQLLILGVTVNMVGITTNLCIVYFASSFTQNLRRSPNVTEWLNRFIGAIFIALGIRLAGEKL
jgi:threonine/homoserine/homoserine lactone efflux protein